MKMMNKVCALVLSVALCAGMAAPAFWLQALREQAQFLGVNRNLASLCAEYETLYTGSISSITGATPTLMGFGNDEDKLVVITDGAKRMKLVAFWRDAITCSKAYSCQTC